ncbi:nicotinamide-nucleotide amidohydrolase family protein [Falsarthrobacter nasiphocae]|uniref:Nicotinamide-nucleotide amidase n=1 Tax=Falsarthrobacter nasiphocae TaxID=189863 RepID=A0AAE3YI77_9MICC|nr:nicotinamide-nucleotide amidohydrolase family protein [Falsarthrobacter nasiphocae]MDR6892670.1 nicotinamide-nucleotide amidase [Falsarthrobacter nasiphocae]
MSRGSVSLPLGAAATAAPGGAPGSTAEQGPDEAMEAEGLSEALVAEATAAGLTVAACESLTAGLVSARIADTPGASAVLRGGFVVYATQTKATVAGLDADDLADDGPVHPRTAERMAEAARERFAANLGVSTTGVAGPGPADGVPAGRVWLAATGLEPRVVDLPGDRAEVRRRAADAALALLLEAVRGAAGRS